MDIELRRRLLAKKISITDNMFVCGYLCVYMKLVVGSSQHSDRCIIDGARLEILVT